MMYDIEKTLFVSDLDGTLLRSDGTLAEETAAQINRMVEAGLKFSFATARSFQTTMKAAGAIAPHIPLILHNGVFIRDHKSGEYIVKNLLADVPFIAGVLAEYEIHPFVYAIHKETQKFSYVPSLLSPQAASFQKTREGDPRNNPVLHSSEIWGGEVFYVSCIDRDERLRPAYERLRERYGCLFGRDYYSGDRWLEILAPEASKANAVCRLRDILGCERVVVFGDAHNDMSMFEAADECYAVAGAAEELKACATAVIGSNDDGAVVTWLREHTGL